MPNLKFLLAASCLVLASIPADAATIFPTSPLIQIGDDTDIFFTGGLAFDFKDNLYSVAAKKSAALMTFTPGFELQYAKDSPLSASLNLSRAFIRYNKTEFKDLETSQDNIGGSLNYAPGGPLTVSLSTSYNESARNDELANVVGGNPAVLAATLLRTASYSHKLNASYRLSEKLSVKIGYINSYNHYLNPTKTTTTLIGPPASEEINYNTNTLSELNTKSIPIDFNYKAPGDNLTYGFSFQHDVTNYSAAPYFSTSQDVSTAPPGPVTNNNRPTSGIQKMTKNFYGLTANGQPTSSGKITITTRLGYFNSDVDGIATSGSSYSLGLSHTLTDRLTQNFNLSRDISPASTGGTSTTDSLTYSLSYSISEKLSANFHVVKSKVVSGATQVDSLGLNTGINWEYNKYIKVSALLDHNDTKVKNAPTADFKANSFNISSTFRY